MNTDLKYSTLEWSDAARESAREVRPPLDQGLSNAYEEEVSVKISGEEHRKRAIEMAECDLAIEELEAEKKRIDAGLKLKIDEIETRRRQLSDVVRTEHELVTLRLVDEKIFALGTVRTWRTDTTPWTLLRERAMELRERQMPLPLDAEPEAVDAEVCLADLITDPESILAQDAGDGEDDSPAPRRRGRPRAAP